MPWHIEKNNEECAKGEYAVVKDDDGEVEGCHETRKKAEKQLAALYANEANKMDVPGKSLTTAVAIKAKTDDSVTIAGYGVIFGGVDLEGETFEPDTDFMLDLVPQKLVLYDHGAQLKHIIGKASVVEPDEFGLWVEAELDRHAEYVAQIEELVKKGALGWSSGSVGHLARRNGKSIETWPIVEFSLTPTPAEPRTLGVEVIKSLAEVDKQFAALLPEESGDGSEQDAADAKATALRLILDLLEMEE